jgi:hypothetical protein
MQSKMTPTYVSHDSFLRYIVGDLKNIKECLSQTRDVSELLTSIFYANLCQPGDLTQFLILAGNELMGLILSG